MSRTPRSFYRLTPAELSYLGVNKIAYVKPMDGEFGIHSANGHLVATTATSRGAFEVIRANDMEPQYIH